MPGSGNWSWSGIFLRKPPVDERGSEAGDGRTCSPPPFDLGAVPPAADQPLILLPGSNSFPTSSHVGLLSSVGAGSRAVSRTTDAGTPMPATVGTSSKSISHSGPRFRVAIFQRRASSGLASKPSWKSQARVPPSYSRRDFPILKDRSGTIRKSPSIGQWKQSWAGNAASF